jgi:hypothetical protein
VQSVPRFLARAAAAGAAVYVAWSVVDAPVRRLVANGAEQVLLRLREPPLVTGLEVGGSGIGIRAAILSPDEFVGWWDATYLPFFAVASLGLVLSVSTRNRAFRLTSLAGTIALCLLAMVGVTAVQVEATTVNYAHQRFGLRLFSEPELNFARRASEAVNFVQLLVPAMAAFFAYAALWADRSGERPARPSWVGTAAAWVLLAALVTLLLRPSAPPGPEALGARFARTLELNPGSSKLTAALVRKMAIDPCGGLGLLRSVLRHLGVSDRHATLRRVEPGLEAACDRMRGEAARSRKSAPRSPLERSSGQGT